LHLAYASSVHQAHPSLLRALDEFERERLGPDRALPKTIVDGPPEAWMKDLALPDLPIRWNARLVEYLHYFRDDPKGQALLHAWLDRLGRYEARLRTVLTEAGVPGDIVYVALVESGFDPRAQSAVGAGGMWQFMEPTARVYGLRGNYWRDERFDYERAAYAAGAYLADLHTRFRTWELALAAYNAGYGLVVKSIRTNNSNSFWVLSEVENGLPRQTINYVPKILATAIAAKNPKVFGYEYTANPAANLVEVSVPGGTRIQDVAQGINIDANLLREYNGHWIRGRTTPDEKSTKLRIPRAKLQAFEGLEPEFRSPEQELHSYSVRLGEHIDEIAERHGVTPKALRRLNGVQDSGELAPGILLAVPPPLPVKDQPPEVKPIVAVPALKSAGGERLVFFRVTRASTPRRISRAFATPWERIVAWNDLDPSARLVDGQMLQIFVSEDFSPETAQVRIFDQQQVRYVVRGSIEHLKALLDDRNMQRRGHKVKEGQSLARIAKLYDLSQGSLARINGVKRGYRPKTGEILVVYLPKRSTRGTVSAPPAQETTLGFEVLVLEGARDDLASSAQTSKLPGRERELEAPEREAVVDDTSDKATEARTRPSTAHSPKLPGKRD
jgi:membrane-bound lytic murein transglycosylase D